MKIALPRHPILTLVCRYLHTTITPLQPPPHITAANHFLNYLVKRGHLPLAHQLFAHMPHYNIVSWTILISAYARHRNLNQSFRLFSHMLSHCKPNDFAYASLLSVCNYPCGIQIHALLLRTGFHAWIYVSNALITMYWNNHCRNAAWKVFEAASIRNLVTYNSMITGLGIHQQGDEAMTLFILMLRDGIKFDCTTLMTLISSLCASNQGSNSILGIECCLQLHSFSIKSGFMLNVGVTTAFIKVYSLPGQDIGTCHKLFLDTGGMHRDALLWTATMTAFVGTDPQRTLFLYNQMRKENLFRDCYVFSILLKACASLVADRVVSAVHGQVMIAGLVNYLEIGNTLIHAYARCGVIDNAEQVFCEMPSKDVISWNSMLKAYAVHGRAEEALGFFKQMDVAPDEMTFVALLTSCSHAGKVKEGQEIFDSMSEKYGITAQLDHYACVVDMLGRSGHLAEAVNIINTMPMQPDYVIWSALLGACQKHGETKLANLASSKLKELDPESSLGYVMMSNIYCLTSSFREGGFIRRKMGSVGVRKEPGLSWIEVGGRVHEFAAGGRGHPQLKAICAQMEELLSQMWKMGYVPNTRSVLFDIEEEHKEEQVYHHSEKLALVFSLMNSGGHNGNSIKIIKNIRTCEDCHNFMRLASKMLHREIIVRDANRFHHFKEGACSCNDYW